MKNQLTKFNPNSVNTNYRILKKSNNGTFIWSHNTVFYITDYGYKFYNPILEKFFDVNNTHKYYLPASEYYHINKIGKELFINEMAKKHKKITKGNNYRKNVVYKPVCLQRLKRIV